MAHAFAVTASSEAAELRQGRGEVTFTVTNVTDHRLTCRTRTVPLEGAAPEWFATAEPDERVLAPSATEQFVVAIAAGKGAPAGRHAFRFDAYAAENPDELYVSGPVVSFELAEPPPPPKPFPWWIVIVAAAGLLVAGVVLWLLLRGSEATVPELVGKPVAEARQALDELDLEVESSERRFVEGQAPEIVVEQAPAKDTALAEDGLVELVVSGAPVDVPQAVGKELAAAIVSLITKGLTVGEIGFRRSAEAAQVGIVAEQSLGKGTRTVAGMPVDLTVFIAKRSFPTVPLKEFRFSGTEEVFARSRVAELKMLQPMLTRSTVSVERLPPPEIAGAPDAATTADAHGCVRLSWSEVTGAQSYGVQIAPPGEGEPASSDLRTIVGIVKPAYAFYPRQGNAGRWRVWAVLNGVAGQKSEWRAFEVAR